MNKTAMAIDQRFVFSDHLIIRCKFVNNDYIPVEILDVDDVLSKIKTLLRANMITFRRSVSDYSHSNTHFDVGSPSLRNRLLASRRSSTPNISKSKSSEQISSCNMVTNSVVLCMSPMTRKKRNSKNRYSTGQILDDVFDSTEGIKFKPEKLSSTEGKTTKCIDTCPNDNPLDYVHIATFTQLVEAEKFLLKLKEMTTTVAVEIDVSETNVISVSYQQLQNFNQEFMMLDLKQSNHMFFLRPF